MRRAGKDAARAFATGCFATHQTYDIRGLDEAEMRVSGLCVGFVMHSKHLVGLESLEEVLCRFK